MALRTHNDDPHFAQKIEAFLAAVNAEVRRAAGLFPTNEHQLAAMGEEVGEVFEAFLDHDRGEDTPEHVYEECVQAAAMNAVLAVAGTAEMAYPFPPDKK